MVRIYAQDEARQHPHQATHTGHHLYLKALNIARIENPFVLSWRLLPPWTHTHTQNTCIHTCISYIYSRTNRHAVIKYTHTSHDTYIIRRIHIHTHMYSWMHVKWNTRSREKLMAKECLPKKWKIYIPSSYCFRQFLNQRRDPLNFCAMRVCKYVYWSSFWEVIFPSLLVWFHQHIPN